MPNEFVVAINAGSSSLRFGVYRVGGEDHSVDAIVRARISGVGGDGHFEASRADGGPRTERRSVSVTSHEVALQVMLDWLEAEFLGTSVVAFGHRVVHGGDRHSEPTLVDSGVLHDLETFTPLAPLHQPHNLAAIETMMRLRPTTPQVACFDTAFHLTQPPLARMFGIPRDLSASGIKRYGFHGLSYEYIAGVLPEVAGTQQADGKVIVAHLGNGASMCAMRNRSSVATTMGFTVLDGLVMGTRCGDLDPGVVAYLMRDRRMSLDDVEELLSQHSGLLGVSGISSDMAVLLASDEPDADEAVALFCYRAGRELGSLVAALGGIDALVFTGGIGENSHEIRQRICRTASWLGIEIDAEANAAGRMSLATPSSSVGVYVIPTDEEQVIAGHTVATAFVSCSSHSRSVVVIGEVPNSPPGDRASGFVP